MLKLISMFMAIMLMIEMTGILSAMQHFRMLHLDHMFGRLHLPDAEPF